MKWSISGQNQKWHVRPAKTQINLGIRPVWSESLLCAQRVAKEPADSEDSDQTGRMPRLIWVFAGRTYHLLVLVAKLWNIQETSAKVNSCSSCTWNFLKLRTNFNPFKSSELDYLHTWTGLFTIVGCLVCFYFYLYFREIPVFNANTVDLDVLRRLTWVNTVCQCPFYGTQDINVLGKRICSKMEQILSIKSSLQWGESKVLPSKLIPLEMCSVLLVPYLP